MQRNVLTLRIILWLGLVGVVGWLLYMGVVPGGKISYVYDFTRPNYFIEKLTPQERVEEIKDGRQKIIGNPIYFSLRTPRGFDKARLTLKYRRYCRDAKFCVSTIPIIEAGVLVDKIIWRYDLQPIENKIIDQLALVWDKQEENGTMLLQKEKKYNSIEDFLENLPARDEITLHNYSLNEEFLLEDYEAEKTEQFTVPAIRGAYQFYTYVKDEILDFNFKFIDLNQNKDNDSIDINLYYGGQLIDSRHLDDDGITGDNDEIKDERQLDLEIASLPEGVYKVEVKVNNDIVTKEICTKQKKLSFINKIWILENGGEEINLVTDSRRLQVQTTNPGSLQTIKVRELASSKDYDQKLELNETYKQFSLELSSKENVIILEEGDTIIAGDGVFSFSLEGLINPDFKKVTSDLDISESGISYILAKYGTPVEEDPPSSFGKSEDFGEARWKIAQAEFDLTNAYREFFKYGFLISEKKIKADDEVEDWNV